VRQGLVLSEGSPVGLIGGGLRVSLLYPHNSFHIDSSFVSLVLGGEVSIVLPDYGQICMHEFSN
jgi:hypothetical protein